MCYYQERNAINLFYCGVSALQTANRKSKLVVPVSFAIAFVSINIYKNLIILSEQPTETALPFVRAVHGKDP